MLTCAVLLVKLRLMLMIAQLKHTQPKFPCIPSHQVDEFAVMLEKLFISRQSTK